MDILFLVLWFCFPQYFYASVYYPKQRMKVLTTVLILGFIFGISQQLRGAHFLSHDIWSLLVCLFVNIGVYSYAYREKPQEVLV